MDIEFTKDDMVADFSELEGLELELANDELDKVLSRSVDVGEGEARPMPSVILSYRESEVCAAHGAMKCLRYMEEHSMDISPLVNLYAIQYGKEIIVNVPNDDELHVALLYDRDDMLEKINRPDVDRAVDILYAMSFELGFRLSYYVTRVRSLFSDEEWYSMTQASVIKLLQLRLGSLVVRCAISRPTCRKLVELGLSSPRHQVVSRHQVVLRRRFR